MMRLVFALLFISACSALYAQVRLPKLVGDSMVVQRDTPLKLWGWAAKGERIKITFNGKRFNTTADATGKWLLTLPPVKAGGPYTLDIIASNRITLKNILAGDVWLCAGQSNMVHYLDLHKERYAAEIQQANDPEIRQFIVPTVSDLQQPADDLPHGHWKAATPQNIGRFSVVAYFFAKKIYERYRVPIGLINASVGGTPIEAWISEEGLNEFPEALSTVEKNKDTAYVNNINRLFNAYIHNKNQRQQEEDKGLAGAMKWYDTALVPTHWRTISVPGYWEDQGIRELDGVVWYRKEIMLPEVLAGKQAKLYLGRVVDADVVYINGERVGSTGYQYPQRRYSVRTGLLKAGKNIVVVRVLNNSGKGGFVPDKPYRLVIGNESIDLTGYWTYRVGYAQNADETPPVTLAPQYQPAASFRGMIAPITNYSLKGILWYQGESNTDKPEVYKQLLPALIADWRKQWKQRDLPFLYVQLPSYMEVSYTPAESQWAILREAQLEALRVPHTGMAVAIDLGEWNDLHPGNKKPVGERLALAALHVAYGDRDVVHSGPLYESHSITDNKIVVHFKNTGSGLVSIDGLELRQFAIAGKDKKFVWANAVIDNNTVVVWNDNVAEPVYIRYAWADNPDGANLYNREGLPASPFRTDR